MRQFFAPEGALGRAFDGYEQREQQIEMAEAVAHAFNHSDAVMVEAGTGTGKGLAYLVPAALFAAQRGERVVISTNTINLQDQLYFKDIPALQRILAADTNHLPAKPPFTAALLKGRGNYLCKRKAAKPRTQKSLLATINARYNKELTEQQLLALLAALCARGLVQVDGAKVSYSLPA